MHKGGPGRSLPHMWKKQPAYNHSPYCNANPGTTKPIPNHTKYPTIHPPSPHPQHHPHQD